MVFKQGNRVKVQPRCCFDGPPGLDPVLVRNRDLGDVEGNYLDRLSTAPDYHIVITVGGKRAVYHTTELTHAHP